MGEARIVRIVLAILLLFPACADAGHLLGAAYGSSYNSVYGDDFSGDLSSMGAG
jgi:hypothetical protein